MLSNDDTNVSDAFHIEMLEPLAFKEKEPKLAQIVQFLGPKSKASINDYETGVTVFTEPSREEKAVGVSQCFDFRSFTFSSTVYSLEVASLFRTPNRRQLSGDSAVTPAIAADAMKYTLSGVLPSSDECGRCEL